MFKLYTFILSALLWFPMQAQAQSSVVVELYTSQGCSSCPPADDILSRLARRDDVIALGMHVEYWDYLGWRDSLAQPSHSKRQAAMNVRLMSRHRLVTPQMIFDGQSTVAGARAEEIIENIAAQKRKSDGARMVARRSGRQITIRLQPNGSQTGDCELHLVSFDPQVPVDIQRGENAGLQINYANVVNAWRTIARWDGAGVFEVTYTLPDDQPVAVLLQEKNHGPILAAQALR